MAGNGAHEHVDPLRRRSRRCPPYDSTQVETALMGQCLNYWAFFDSASISASVGKRPSAFLENLSWPLTKTSNTPPLERTSSMSASVSFCSRALAPRALGS